MVCPNQASDCLCYECMCTKCDWYLGTNVDGRCIISMEAEDSGKKDSEVEYPKSRGPSWANRMQRLEEYAKKKGFSEGGG